MWNSEISEMEEKNKTEMEMETEETVESGVIPSSQEDENENNNYKVKKKTVKKRLQKLTNKNKREN